MKLNSIKIKLPIYFNIIVIKKNYSNNFYILIFNDEKFLKIYRNDDNIYIDKITNTIEILNKNMFSIKKSNNLNLFLKSLNYYFFKKIKFKGKGYKMRFYNEGKMINFYFGRSHKTIMKYKNIKLKIIGKYKFILLSTNKFKLDSTVKKTINIKYLNQYTLRGLRLSKQIIFKRTGKKGSYV